jgi:ribosomal protein S18 acetylase RimI-like enzyme
MAELIQIDDKARLAKFFAADLPLHIYEIGDLDDFFWPHTKWFGWESDGDLQAVALFYSGASMPTLLLLERHRPAAAMALLRAVQSCLPRPYYSHLSPALKPHLAEENLTPHGRHLKMSLGTDELIRAVDTNDVERLGPSHCDELSTFYEKSYPRNWFMPHMLETGQYFCIRSQGALVAVAGVHVYSPEYGVAALGNITTAPEHRGKGLGRRVTAHLCKSLLERTNTVGLNVHAENESAIRCYQGLGFDVVAEYDEFMFETGDS